MKAFLALSLLILGAIPNTAHAQQLMNFITRTTIPIVIQCPGCNARNQEKKSPNSRPLAVRPKPAALASAAQLSFVPSPALRQRNYAAIVDKMRPRDAEAADQMAEMFASTDMIDQVAREIAPAGLQTNSVADAFTFWWATTWSVSREQPESGSRAALQSVRAQVVNIMLADQGIARATAAQKQEFAEDLFVKSRLLNTAVKEAQGNPDDLASLARTARKTALAAGLDLDTMELTEAGFVSGKR